MAQPQTYSTRYLQGVLANLKRPTTFLTNRYFKKIALFDTEEVSFDIETADEKLAPFVAPVVAGAVLLEKGFTTTTIKPASIKVKTPLEPFKNIKRTIGETFGKGELTPAARQQLRVAATLSMQQDRITRTLEWMASSILCTSKVIIEGEGYPRIEVDFQRSAALGIQLTLADRWSEASADPVRDIENWAQQAFDESGAVVEEIVFDSKAWAAFRKNEKVLKLLDIRRAEGAGPLNIGPSQPVADGAVYKGSLNNFQLFVYNGGYVADNGVRTPYLPAGTVLGMSAAFDGSRYFGAIMDEEANLKAWETFTKSWINQDPAVRYILSQTSPILAPGRKDANFCARVF